MIKLNQPHKQNPLSKAGFAYGKSNSIIKY